jgi:hypothetical protein
MFNKASDLVGRSLTLDGEGYEIIGVLSGTRLEFDIEPDFYLPMNTTRLVVKDQARTLDVYGRTRPGVAFAQAQTELQDIEQEITRAYPADHSGHFVGLKDLRSATTPIIGGSCIFFWRPRLL